MRAINPAAEQLFRRAHAERILESGLDGRVCFPVCGSEQLEHALRLEPSFADAWAELALLILAEQTDEKYPEAAVPRARAAADRALQLEADNATARIALARIRLAFDWDWDGAGREFRRALELDPSNFDARWNYAG